MDADGYVLNGLAIAALVGAMSMGVSGAASASLGLAAAPAVNCNWHPTSSVTWGATFSADAVNIRSGPDVSCRGVSQGYSGQPVTIYCYSGNWWYLTDNATRVSGWASMQYVKFDPKNVPDACS